MTLNDQIQVYERTKQLETDSGGADVTSGGSLFYH